MSQNGTEHTDNGLQKVIPVSGLYKNWFLEYASYVILDRAVPSYEDGLKPVQRRILHALKNMDDGRFHKVANLVGQTMQFHPHGDASIYEALVNLGQKDLLIETQGNWGDFRTGDSAAAARYIEARLSKFALEVAFNKDVTEWQLSYDGRKNEPVNLPMKFPLLLAQGVEGIAVGLSTKILPHNFIELLKASIQILKGRTPKLLPDFPTGGLADCSNYNGGKRGGRVKVRARIEIKDKKTLLVKDLPYGVTTTSLIESIVKANDRNKIKIKKVTDNTAEHVEIEIELPPNVSPDVTLDALYAFTNCEVSIAPNCCIIIDDKPEFLDVNELLKRSTDHTVDLHRQELEYRLKVLMEKLHFASLEQIFIENRIYRRIEECETFEAVIEEIDKGLKPFKKQFIREITRDDIIRLTEIRIKRISKYDSFKADEAIRKLQDEIKEVQHHLDNIIDYAIDYFQNLIKKYGKGRERKTEITSFQNIKVRQVAIANQKLYVNRKDGFIGYGLKKDEYICDCSDIADIIVVRKNGKFQVCKISDKVFVGKDIIHVDVWQKGDERKIYHAVHYDAKSKNTYVKRFAVTAITRNREYDLTTDVKGSKLLYFAVHANSEAETINVLLSSTCKAKIKNFEFNFSELAIKGRSARGNILTKYPVRKVTQQSVGASTLGGRKIWYDDTVGRLNTDSRGKYLGEFDTGDNVLVLNSDGNYILTDFELSNHYDTKKLHTIEKFDPEKVLSLVYYHGERKTYHVKRFKVETTTIGQAFSFMEGKGSKIFYLTTGKKPVIDITYQSKARGPKLKQSIRLEEFIDVKGWRSIGNKLPYHRINLLKELSVEKITPSPEKKTGKSGTKTATKKQKLELGKKVELDVSKDKQGSLFD